MITSSAGVIQEESDYYPFGGERAVTNGDPNQYKFTAKERDTESNLDFFIARYYSSAQGRFLSVDPENSGASEDDPQSWNAYAYARNNPLLYMDPDGLAYVVTLFGTWGPGFICECSWEHIKMVMTGWERTYYMGDEWKGSIWLKTDNGDIQIGEYRHFVSDDDRFQAASYGVRMAEPGVNAAMVVTAPNYIAAAAGTGAGFVVIEGVVYTYQQLAALGSGAIAELIAAGKLSKDVVQGLITRFPQLMQRAGDYLFARHGTGLLNSNDWIRLGFSWEGSTSTGREVFRFVIGSKRTFLFGKNIHWHVFSIPW